MERILLSIMMCRRVKWWDWSNAKIRKNFELINNPDIFFDFYNEGDMTEWM